MTAAVMSGSVVGEFATQMVIATPEALAGVGVLHDLFVSDDVLVNRYVIRKGTEVRKHMHDYSHLSAVLKGKVLVAMDGGDAREYSAGDIVLIPAGVSHSVLALEDSIWACIHSAKVS